ncbi:MAG: twin transmembrane helix small protein [Paracoccaceae bacterium]|nr:MAG: twin transmembrane helix small protein [Paracoccaceae bacterium]
MFNDPLLIVAIAACLLVLVILMVGVGGFARGGDFNKKHANRIMRYRIYAQAGAVAIILIYVTLRGATGS